MKNDEYMQVAIDEAREGIKNKDGGPFGCCIVKDGKIISKAHNIVLKSNDPTAHAEVQAIRIASNKLGTYDLSDCVLYTTCEPCPMCLFSILWAKIKRVYYTCDRVDAANIGFRDELFYSYLNDNIKLEKISLDKTESLKLFSEYQKNNNIIY